MQINNYEKNLLDLKNRLPDLPITLLSRTIYHSVQTVLDEFLFYDTTMWLTLKGQEQLQNYESLKVNPYIDVFVTDWVMVLACFRYKEKKEMPIYYDLELAIQRDKLACYFSEVDILRLFDLVEVKMLRVHSREIVEREYYMYVRDNFPKKYLAMKYLEYMDHTARSVSLGMVDYTLFTTDFYYRSQSQREQYDYVFSQVDRVMLPSDGLGIASCMCILQDKDYQSWEPNDIGDVAIKLGIITSKEPIYDESYIYCFFYCVQYYEVPMIINQRYIVWDVVGQKKPGRKKNDYCSTNLAYFSTRKWDETHKSKHMVIDSYYPVDAMAYKVLQEYGFEKKENPYDAQYVVAMTMTGLELAMNLGIYSNSYWKENLRRYNEVKEELDEDDTFHQLYQFSISKIIKLMKDKTLLFSERTFPFRVKNRLAKVRNKYDFFFRDYGPTNYFFEGAMMPGSNKIGVYIESDYTLVSGKIIVPHVRPEIIKYVRLRKEHVAVFNKVVLKVYLLSTYFNQHNGRYYAVYVDEREARPVLGELRVDGIA